MEQLQFQNLLMIINNCYPTKNYNIRTIARGVDLDFDPNNCKTQQVELIIKNSKLIMMQLRSLLEE